jgi:TonB family protein
MSRDYCGKSPFGLRKAVARLFYVAALALVVALAMPARAADERAIKSRVAPIYPEIARRMKIGGAVMVEATVDPEGRVNEVKAVSGNRMLTPAAEDAVRQWKFVSGPSSVRVKVEVNFALTQ